MRRAASLLLLVMLGGCGSGKVQGDWFAFTQDGDKPGVGILLSYADGVVHNGAFYILLPDFPGDTRHGLGYVMDDVHTEGNGTVRFSVSLIDGVNLRRLTYELVPVIVDGVVESGRIHRVPPDGGGGHRVPLHAALMVRGAGRDHLPVAATSS